MKVIKKVLAGCSNASVLLLPIFCIAVLLGSCKNNADNAEHKLTGALKPDEAVGSFELEQGFQIELVASEPMVTDPVDMEIDEYGRMYVVEMHGYPLDKSGSGKIKMLTDTDADGKFDKATVFAEQLVLPNGIMRWKKGIIVSDAPNILYFEDRDGDGKSDFRDTLLTGFSLSNPHINVNNPMYGLDNYIHLAHLGAITTRNYENIFGDKGDIVYYPDYPNAPKLPKNADNHSVRFRPDKQLLETTSGHAQFGHTFDKWGHFLYGDNQNHATATVIAAPYVNRNPELPVAGAIEAISDHGAAAEIYQITTNPERQMFSGVGTMTSACGIVSYNGGLFPKPFDENVTFICESVSNLVHADKQRDTGATFVSSRVGEPRKEFLASRDAWFRPVNTYVGPDGALYIVDYYRQIIEHPEWMSEEAVKAGGLYNGKDMGRIYRITPTGTKPAEWIKGLKLGDATSKELVAYLGDKNVWWRLNAQRLLVDRADSSVVPALEAMAANTTSVEGRLHALWTLEGLGRLTAAVITTALQDEVAGIRENAIKLAEIHLGQYPQLSAALIKMQDDNNAKVRFQLLCTLGSVNGTDADKARNKLLFRDINDKWVQIAALSAASSHSGSLLPLVLSSYKADVPAYASLVQRITNMIGSGKNQPAIHQLIVKATATQNPAPWQGPVLQGLASGLRSNGAKAIVNSEQPLLVKTFFDHPDAAVQSGALSILNAIGLTDEVLQKTAIAKAATIAADTSLPNDKRANAVNFLALGNPAEHTALLKKLIVPQEHPSVQLASIKTLSLVPDLTVNQYILQEWPALTPGIRDAALATFMTNPQRMSLLLDAVESNKIPRASLGWSRTSSLMGQDIDSIRNRARALLVNKDQEKINKDFEEALTMHGDWANGKKVFTENCGLCHQVRGELGLKFGPDLGTVQNWLAKDIMANVLAPNASIATGFDLWDVKLKTGESLQGIISSETSTAVTLKQSSSQEKLINRQDIETLTVMTNSAMPVLTSQLNHQQMADLLAFLRQTK